MSQSPLDSRLIIADQLVEAVDVERSILERSWHQELLMSFLKSLPLEHDHPHLQHVDAQIKDIVAFTERNQNKIDVLQHQRDLILQILSAKYEAFYINGIAPQLLEDGAKLLAEVQQIPDIKSNRRGRLERARLEKRVRIIMSDSYYDIPMNSPPRGPDRTVKAMESLCTALKHLQDRARQLRSYSAVAVNVRNVEDPRLTFRLAQVRNGLVHIQETRSKLATDIATIEDATPDLLSSLNPTPKSTLQEVVGALEVKVNMMVVDFFRGNKESLQFALNNKCFDIEARLNLQEVVGALEAKVNAMVDFFKGNKETLHLALNSTSFDIEARFKLKKLTLVEDYIPNRTLDNNDNATPSHI